MTDRGIKRNWNETIHSIALHDFENQNIDWVGWFKWSEEFFAKHNLEPNRGGITGTSKSIGYKAFTNRLKKADLASLRDLSISCQRAKDCHFEDFFAYTSIEAYRQDQRYTTTFREIQVLCIDDEYLPKNLALYKELLLEYQQFTKAKYGYFYTQRLGDVPSLYPTGSTIALYDLSEEEERIYHKWQDKYMSNEDYHTGDLRQVYELNLLSNEHLEREVMAGVNFHDWINAENRGIITEEKPGIWIWQVEESNIIAVNNKLKNTGILLAWYN